MRIIKTALDFKLLSASKALPEEFLTCLNRFFTQLKQSYSDSSSFPFSLAPYSLIAVLEGGDNIFDLSPILVDSPNNGLLNANIKAVERWQCQDCNFYHIFVLDDARQVHVFIQDIVLDSSLEGYIQQFIAEPVKTIIAKVCICC